MYFFNKKWKKEHIAKRIFCVLVLIAVVVLLKLKGTDPAVIGSVAGLLAVLFNVVLYNQMMAYVEDHAYGKIEK